MTQKERGDSSFSPSLPSVGRVVWQAERMPSLGWPIPVWYPYEISKHQILGYHQRTTSAGAGIGGGANQKKMCQAGPWTLARYKKHQQRAFYKSQLNFGQHHFRVSFSKAPHTTRHPPPVAPYRLCSRKTMTTPTTNRYRMAAFDLDGTLLNSNHQLSDKTVEYLRKLHSQGFIIAIATGRSAACTAHIIEKLDLGPMSRADAAHGFPLVCTNGARGLRIMKKAPSEILGDSSEARPTSVKRCNTMPADVRGADDRPRNPLLRETLVIDVEMFHERLSEDLTLKVLKLADNLGCMVNYYHDHHIYVAPRNGQHLEAAERYKTLTGSEEFFVYLNDVTKDLSTQSFNEANCWGYKEAVRKGLPSKLIIFCDSSILDKVVDDCRVHLNGSSDPFDQSYRYNAHIIRGAPPFFVEVLNPGVHKGRGLVRLCEYLQLCVSASPSTLTRIIETIQVSH